jgi:maltose O-acetyltransferase
MTRVDRLRSALRGFVAHRVLGRLDREALLARGLAIGQDTFVDPDVAFDVDFCWLISIGDRATIAPGVRIVAHDASTKRALGYTRVARVHVGDDTFVGAGSLVLPGVTIGAGAIVGAGSVVRHDVPAGAVVSGDPAQVRDDTAAYLARRRAALVAAPTFGGPRFDPRRGLSDPLNHRIREATAQHRDVFVV